MMHKTEFVETGAILGFIAMIEVRTPKLSKSTRDFLMMLKKRCIEHDPNVWMTYDDQCRMGELLMDMCERGTKPPMTKTTH